MLYQSTSNVVFFNTLDRFDILLVIWNSEYRLYGLTDEEIAIVEGGKAQ